MLLKSAFIALFSLYNVDTTMLKECENQADKISGCVERSYHSNGNLWEETPYKNGKLNGMSKWYYENGNLDAEISYKNDKLHGIGKWYYENGNIKLEITYKDSKQEGVMKMYDTSGNLRAEVSALNNVLHGDTKLYTEDKKLFAIITNRYGETIFSKCLNGKVLTDKELSKNDIFKNPEKTINYLQEICLKEGDSR